MSDQVYFDDLEVGGSIPTLTVTATQTQMFFFSAATYNGHRIHYDLTWAREVEGYENILVHGPLQSALLTRAVTDWVGGDGKLVSYSIQNRASAYPGEELRFMGTIVGKREENGQALVDLEIHGEKGEAEILMPGRATVQLPKRNSEGN